MLTPIPPSDCTRARESASASLDGELAELEAAQLEAHLRSCPECQTYADGIAVSTGLLRAAPLDQPSAAMFTAMPQRRRRIGALPATAAAAIVVAVARLLLLRRRRGRPSGLDEPGAADHDLGPRRADRRARPACASGTAREALSGHEPDHRPLGIQP